MHSEQLPLPTLSWVKAALGPGHEIIAIHPQGGSTSSTLHSLEVQTPRGRLALVLRRFTNREWLAEEPGIAEHEAASLHKVRHAGLPTPELVACDPDGAQAGIPALLMTRLPGRVDLHPRDFDLWLREQAAALLPIHALNAADFPWRYTPYHPVDQFSPPTWSHQPHLWEQAAEIIHSPPPPTPERFIHRDYHPVNLLWQEGRLSGVVDWPNACLGPAGIDVSWNRANLASLYGVQAAERFLAHYQSLTGSASGYHPYWDLMVINDFLPGPPNVYPPWIEYGMQGLTDALMLERAESYLVSVLEKLR